MDTPRSPMSDQRARLARYDWWAACVIGVLAVGFVGLVAVLAGINDVSFRRLARDPVAAGLAGDLVWYSGWISNFGAVMWTVGVTASAMALAVTWGAGSRRQRWFFASSAVLTAVLLVDDLYMIHDYVGPRRLGIPELAVLAGIVVIALVWGTSNLPALWRSADLPLLGLACVFFAVSLTLDVFDQQLRAGSVREEGSKLVAILCWMAFHVRVALRALAPRDEAPKWTHHAVEPAGNVVDT